MVSPLIIPNEDHYQVDEARFCTGRLSAHSQRSPASSNTNEDSLAYFEFSPSQGVIVVADGAGGLSGGETASRLVVENFAKIEKASDLRPAILSAIEQANRSIRELGIGAGSTLATVEINGDTIRPYHVGDSSIYVVGNRGKLKLQTLAHSPVGYAVESGFLKEREALTHEDRHMVSNLVGLDDMRIEIGSPLQLSPRDTLLLTTDGLSDNFTTHGLLENIRAGSLPQIRATLVKSTLHRMENPEDHDHHHIDDFTFVLFRLRDE